MYRYKVQGQLHITGCSWCDFVIYTLQDISIEKIDPDKGLWDKVVPKLELFYMHGVLPVLGDLGP